MLLPLLLMVAHRVRGGCYGPVLSFSLDPLAPWASTRPNDGGSRCEVVSVAPAPALRAVCAALRGGTRACLLYVRRSTRWKRCNPVVRPVSAQQSPPPPPPRGWLAWPWPCPLREGGRRKNTAGQGSLQWGQCNGHLRRASIADKALSRLCFQAGPGCLRVVHTVPPARSLHWRGARETPSEHCRHTRTRTLAPALRYNTDYTSMHTLV